MYVELQPDTGNNISDFLVSFGCVSVGAHLTTPLPRSEKVNKPVLFYLYECKRSKLQSRSVKNTYSLALCFFIKIKITSESW